MESAKQTSRSARLDEMASHVSILVLMESAKQTYKGGIKLLFPFIVSILVLMESAKQTQRGTKDKHYAGLFQSLF